MLNLNTKMLLLKSCSVIIAGDPLPLDVTLLQPHYRLYCCGFVRFTPLFHIPIAIAFANVRRYRSYITDFIYWQVNNAIPTLTGILRRLARSTLPFDLLPVYHTDKFFLFIFFDPVSNSFTFDHIS